VPREQVTRRKRYEIPTRADYDFGREWKPAREFTAQSLAAHGRVDHERSRRTDIHSIQVAQLVSQRGRSEGLVTADVDASQQDHECHEPLVGALLVEKIVGCRGSVIFTISLRHRPFARSSVNGQHRPSLPVLVGYLHQ
jgi:hypothetical protein